MSWSKDYKKSIDCKNPKGFSQKAHCAARKKRQRGEETKSMSPFNEDVQSVKKIKFSKFTHKTPHLKGGQHVLDPNVDLKQLVHHATVQYLDRDADGDIDIYDAASRKTPDENVMSAPGEAQKRSLKLIAKQKGEMLHTKRGSAFESVEMRYCKLCRKMEARTDCSYGPKMWDKYSVAKVHPANEAKDHEYSMARSELSTIINGAKRLHKKMKKGEGEIEAWVQSKITKAADYIDAAADYVDSGEMNKEEVEILEGKRDGKSAKDPGYSLRDWFKGGGWVQAGGKYDGKPCAKQPGQKTKPFCRDADDRAAMSKDEREKRAKKKRKEDPNPNRKGKAKIVREETNKTIGVKSDNVYKTLQQMVDRQKLGGKVHIPPGELKNASGINLGAHFEPEGEMIDEKKDACYSKVKSRYKVWPSAYASGALVKCRKVGAANWGNKSESYEFSNWRDEFFPTEIETIDIIKPEPIKGVQEDKDPCWVGYKQVGMKKKGKRMVPNCVKTEEFSNWREELLEQKGHVMPNASKKGSYSGGPKGAYKVGDTIPASATKQKPSVYQRIKAAGDKYGKEAFQEDWQSVNRKDKTDGMSDAAVNAYRRENPDSKLQTAVTEKNPEGKRAERRKSFCRRMKGHKAKNTSAKTARDPDSRINKALRRWRCR